MSQLSAVNAEKIDRASPDNQVAGLGTEVRDLGLYVMMALEAEVTADATGGQSITVPFACEVVDVIVECRAANGSGTLTLKKGATAITDAIVCAVDKVVARAGTIDDAQSALAAGDDLNVDANGAGDRGKITVLIRRA